MSERPYYSEHVMSEPDIETGPPNHHVNISNQPSINVDPLPCALCLRVSQASILFVLLSTAIILCSVYSVDWEKDCDLRYKAWSLTWIVRYILQLIINMHLTSQHIAGRTPKPMWTRVAQVVQFAGFCVWLAGVESLCFEPLCEPETTAMRTTKVMVYTSAFLYTMPLILYLLLCLCIPCLLCILVRMSRPTSDGQPTPPDIVEKLRRMKFAEIASEIRTQRGSEDRQKTPSLTQLVSSVGGLLSGRTGDSLSGDPPNGTVLGGPLLTQGPSPEGHNGTTELLSNRVCPVCMMEFEPEDQVIVLPCDNRHFFHTDCVSSWLKTSQVCPMCRANLVQIIDPGRLTETRSPNDENAIEFQVATTAEAAREATGIPVPLRNADRDDDSVILEFYL